VAVVAAVRFVRGCNYKKISAVAVYNLVYNLVYDFLNPITKTLRMQYVARL
jgi:hypothetical protein